MHISVGHFLSICILTDYTYERWSYQPPSYMTFYSVTLPVFQQNVCSMFPHLESGWTCGCLTNTDWQTWCFLSSEAGTSKRCRLYLVLWSSWVGLLRSRLPWENLTTLRLSAVRKPFGEPNVDIQIDSASLWASSLQTGENNPLYGFSI